jgi:[acyl-carrier-protein] S-malonyltransferase
MGRALAEGYEVARRAFEEADDVLGYALSRICFDGPAERLVETDVCQPALVATSVAAYRVAHDAGLRPGLVLGHSLGEYSALVAGGALGFADALRLVAERGAAMHEAGRASPGAMVALLGPSDDEARALADAAGDAWPANFNCPGQVVVSGTVAGIDRLVALAEARSVRVARLAVDGAYHSPLMAPAAARLRPALEAWEPATPDPPFLSSTTVALEPPERLREVLLAQLTSPVRFGDAVEAALAAGAERFVEVGPGRVLSGLVRRVRRDVPVSQVGEPADVDALAAVG